MRTWIGAAALAVLVTGIGAAGNAERLVPALALASKSAPAISTDTGATAPDATAPDSGLEADADMSQPAAEGTALGPVTNLPLPRYVSLKTNEANVRRGPSLSHRIDWVFTRRDMPLQVVAEYGHWRRVIDRDGMGGWVHYSMLSGVRTVIVDKDMEPLYALPDTKAAETAILQAGVIGRLGTCDKTWCRITAGGYSGWTPKSVLWGVDADEIRN
ncbi:MAG: RNA-binding protein [Limimaricola sp.]|uniref:SH3 domain-containing protein n=1 Tax=Limimaricola sp. TaxID=2211665 RepID=UPI001DE62DD9|nr:SH3 domain-containing protein [Limimaricola sp.]MBI1417749.1 RNA-binding protein [Limimaricola sp.]